MPTTLRSQACSRTRSFPRPPRAIWLRHASTPSRGGRRHRRLARSAAPCSPSLSSGGSPAQALAELESLTRDALIALSSIAAGRPPLVLVEGRHSAPRIDARLPGTPSGYSRKGSELHWGAPRDCEDGIVHSAIKASRPSLGHHRLDRASGPVTSRGQRLQSPPGPYSRRRPAARSRCRHTYAIACRAVPDPRDTASCSRRRTAACPRITRQKCRRRVLCGEARPFRSQPGPAGPSSQKGCGAVYRNFQDSFVGWGASTLFMSRAAPAKRASCRTGRSALLPARRLAARALGHPAAQPPRLRTNGDRVLRGILTSTPRRHTLDVSATTR